LSNKYRIFETEEFLKKLKKPDQQDQIFIQSKLRSHIYPQIGAEPFFGKNIKKLKGYIPETYRYRIGKFRLFYIVDHTESMIYILTVDYRKDAYR
jgi:mRNA interferase RelE/StbE